MCTLEQSGTRARAYTGACNCNRSQTTVASAWVLLVIVVGLAAGVESTTGLIALVTVGLLPPLGVLLLWNDPTPTLNQSIAKVLR